MIVKYTKNKIDYILSNENLEKGDKVYPISRGRCCTYHIHLSSYYVHYEYDFRDFCSGFPDDPHVIEDETQERAKTVTTRAINLFPVNLNK